MAQRRQTLLVWYAWNVITRFIWCGSYMADSWFRGRVYATYSGIFITLSLLWAWKVDGFKPDRYDIIGAVVAIVGVSIILYAPRQISQP
ncbi:YnfA family protein [Mucilaginibacter sp. PAMB04274]|uniref:YnfA family protein n=1 Tax=Mucilaginibacter sp. PAMB04274 TaxID=3138568 RepID=UPI0031F6128A